jgi:hypothetical protein
MKERGGRPVSRGKRPLKLLVDSPFAEAPVPTVAAPDAEAVVGLLVETHKRNKTSVLCGVNAVARGLGQLALVVVCGEGAPPVLTQHLVEGSQAAQCRLVTLPVTAEAMGRALGVRRVLALGVRRDAVEAGSLLATVGAVPGVFWLPPGPVSYLPLKIGTTESKATPEAYAKRVQRKQEFAQKQIRLRQKRDEERRAKKGLKDGKNVKAPRGRGRKKAKQEAIEQWLAQTKKPAKIIAD